VVFDNPDMPESLVDPVAIPIGAWRS